MPIRTRMAVFGAIILAAIAISTAPATAQATRTWVSGVGDDVNPCSRTAPCKTFAGAISKTAASGEINCLDSGGFGAVTITKAIAIRCEGVIGGIAAAATNGVNVNAGANDAVYLYGLDIQGAATGLSGVRFTAGAALHIENSIIRAFNGSPALGVSFAPSGASELYISNVTIAENGAGDVGGGIEIKPTGAGSAKVELKSVLLQNNAGSGLRIDATGNTAARLIVSIDDNQFSGNGHGISVSAPTGPTAVRVMVANSTIANNNDAGVLANGGGATVRVGNTVITGNGAGLLVTAGAIVNSYGDNRLDGNVVNNAFTPPVIPRR